MPFSSDTFEGLTGSMFSLILQVDNLRAAMGDRLGVGATGLKTMAILNRGGSVTAGALANSAGITSGSMSATIDKLVANGLATRTSNPVDRRGVLVELTPEGTAAVAWAAKYYHDALAVPLARDADTEVIASYLSEVSNQLAALAKLVPDLPR